MEMIKFSNGKQYFWVKDSKKIKFWKGLIGLPMSTVIEIDRREV